MNAPAGCKPAQDCPDRDMLFAFSVGNLAQAMLETIADHVTHCARCEATLGELEGRPDPFVAELRQPLPPGILPEAAAPALAPVESTEAKDKRTALPNPTATEPWGCGACTDQAPGMMVPSPPAEGPPLELPGYDVQEKLGQGGMGIVYRAFDRRLQRPVAVKVMRPELACLSDARERFLREARAVAKLNHEHVVAIHGVDEAGGRPFLVMPLLSGETLATRLERERRLSPAEVIRIGREVAAGLAAAHALGLVHRDIKPANIWLAAETDKAILLDFGLARAVDGADGLTAPGMIRGTPQFMAPEQLDGKPVDGRSDLFSLGATLYQCATGRPAFPGSTFAAILNALAAHETPLPHQVNPTIPAALSELIMRLLAKDPTARPQSAQDVIKELAALGGQPTVKDGDPALAVARTRRRPSGYSATIQIAVTAALLLALIVGLTAIGGWVLLNRQGNGSRGPVPPSGTAPPLMRYRAKVDVRVERADEQGKFPLLRLHEAGALPLRKTDKFRIEGEVDPPAYLYVVWVDPGHDITPVYPWNAAKGWGSRPPMEQPVGRVSLPPNAGKRYTAPDAKSGVATMVLFARPTPLDVPDEVLRRWFEGLPDLPLPPGGEHAAVWFDNYVEVNDPDRPRTFQVVGADDPFAIWQGRLQEVLGGSAAFETAVSFARTGAK
jgi:hypothetical protein